MAFKVLKDGVFVEETLACLTLKPYWRFVDIKVFLLIGDLVEGHAAPLDRTLEGLLPCVYPQVVEEVVPFSEQFPTAIVIAAEHSWVSAIASGLGELEHWEILRRRDVAFAQKFRYLNILALYHIYGHRIIYSEFCSHSLDDIRGGGFRVGYCTVEALRERRVLW